MRTEEATSSPNSESYGHRENRVERSEMDDFSRHTTVNMSVAPDPNNPVVLSRGGIEHAVLMDETTLRSGCRSLMMVSGRWTNISINLCETANNKVLWNMNTCD